MDKFLANEILVARVFRMDGNCAITKHGFDTGGGDFDLLGGVVLKLILEMHDNSELDLLFVARNFEESSLLDIDVLDLNVRNGSFKSG